MPYKHKNIEYGLPHEEYPEERIKKCVETLKETIDLTREPVGITFLFTKEEYESYPVDEIRSATAYCVMVKDAAVRGRGVKCRLEHHRCDGATTAFALEESTEKIESGQEYFSYKLYSSVAVARRMRAAIKSLHREPVSTYERTPIYAARPGIRIPYREEAKDRYGSNAGDVFRINGFSVPDRGDECQRSVPKYPYAVQMG